MSCSSSLASWRSQMKGRAVDEEVIWMRRSCGRGGHVDEEIMWMRRSYGRGGHVTRTLAVCLCLKSRCWCLMCDRRKGCAVNSDSLFVFVFFSSGISSEVRRVCVHDTWCWRCKGYSHRCWRSSALIKSSSPLPLAFLLQNVIFRNHSVSWEMFLNTFRISVNSVKSSSLSLALSLHLFFSVQLFYTHF